MNLNAIRIIEPGPLSTVQDCGRFGYQDRGVPVSGAMDLQALRIANLLAGNRDAEAGIEITWGGFRAEFLAQAQIAVSGADPKPRLNGRPFPCGSGILAQKGDILEMNCPETGCRTYLAVSGGVDVPEVMGSRSTYLRGGFGGHNGRALQKGDVLGMGQGRKTPVSTCPRALIPKYCDHPVLRITLGPQADALTPESLGLFLSSPYIVTDRYDRMGCSLKGPILVHQQKADIVSDGTVFGAVQVPGSGQPIILMADRQTIGGYVKPATVISVDLPLLAQLVPGSSVRFEAVSLWTARELAITAEYRFQKWINHEPSR
jgi:biotin-dependent carboxylase-like uncharacterized protein